MSQPSTFIHWFHKDLRLSDHPALSSAQGRGKIVGLFILDDESVRPLGGASRVWLHHSLVSLAKDCAQLGIPLILKRGKPSDIIPQLCKALEINMVTATRNFEPAASAEQNATADILRGQDRILELHDGSLLHDPRSLRTGGGKPYQVYTPFWKSLLAREDIPQPLPRLKPQSLDPLIQSKAASLSENLSHWNLLPTRPNWSGGIEDFWAIGEKAAQKRLQHFLDDGLSGYKENRNRPDMLGTSRLSPHLHWGEISPRQIWFATMHHQKNAPNPDGETFLKEVVWREFSYHLLTHFPQLPTQPLRAQFQKFPWKNNSVHLRAWQRGQTGYPIVDAGMRELWQTGWMHNRVRMIVASFLIKHLLQDWRLGEEWFWDTLVDADAANNAASWQWVAGSGADAAPYFRIFNPILQGEKFDPNGDYVRRYVPELARLDKEFIHKPWMAPPLMLAGAGIVLGKHYPEPIVDHDFARKRALAALAEMNGE